MAKHAAKKPAKLPKRKPGKALDEVKKDNSGPSATEQKERAKRKKALDELESRRPH